MDGQDIEVVVRRNARAKRYTLSIDAATRNVRITVPRGGSEAHARDFANRQLNWIRTRLARLPDAISFVDGAVIPFHGEPHRLFHENRARGLVRIENRDGQDMPTIVVPALEPHMKRRLTDWLKKEARRALTAASEEYASRLGVKVTKITLRDPRSRWGSCAADGSLSYSWRLILAPPDVLDYVTAHEVAHLIEMNHSAAFWAIVKDVCPQMASAKTWLKTHGKGLHGIGVG